MTRIRVSYDATTDEIEIDGGDIDPVAQQILDGMTPHFQSVIETVWITFDMEMGDFDGINRMLKTFEQEGQRAGFHAGFESFDRLGPEYGLFRQKRGITDDGEWAFLQDLAANAVRMLPLTLAALEDSDFRQAVAWFGQSVSWSSFHEALLEEFVADDNAPARAAANALSFRRDQVFKPKWEAFVRQVIASGAAAEIGTIKELLRHPDCPPNATQHATPEKLREWAGKVGFAFRRGAARSKK